MSAKNEPSLEIEYLPVKELVPYAGNAKKHPDEQIAQIALSIKEFGNCDPIAVWHDGDGNAIIVEGHGRVLALNTLGIKEAPVIYLDHLTDAQRRAYTHVHNQTTLSSGFDFEVLEAEIAELPDFDWQAMGFSSINDIDIDSFFSPDPQEAEKETEDGGQPEEVTCPNCGERFVP